MNDYFDFILCSTKHYLLTYLQSPFNLPMMQQTIPQSDRQCEGSQCHCITVDTYRRAYRATVRGIASEPVCISQSL